MVDDTEEKRKQIEHKRANVKKLLLTLSLSAFGLGSLSAQSSRASSPAEKGNGFDVEVKIKDASENKEPSAQTINEINEGINFVGKWLAQRVEAGKLTSGKYLQSLQKLKNIRVFTTGKDSDRVIEALENGEVHLSQLATRLGYDIERIKNNWLANPRSETRCGYNARETLKEPAIFINVDRINQFSASGEIPGLSSIVAHEVAHLLNFTDDENIISEILQGKYREDNNAASERKTDVKAMTFNAKIIGDTDAPLYRHGENIIDGAGVSVSSFDNTKKSAIRLNSGIDYSDYLDSGKEIYARIMQMRKDMKLDPYKVYTPKDVQKLRDESNFRRKMYHTGDEFSRGYNIFERYSNEQISRMLNDTAENTPSKQAEKTFITTPDMYRDAGRGMG